MSSKNNNSTTGNHSVFSNEGRMIPVNISISLKMLEKIDLIVKQKKADNPNYSRSEFFRDAAIKHLPVGYENNS